MTIRELLEWQMNMHEKHGLKIIGIFIAVTTIAFPTFLYVENTNSCIYKEAVDMMHTNETIQMTIGNIVDVTPPIGRDQSRLESLFCWF
jgi:hypothetical protein